MRRLVAVLATVFLLLTAMPSAWASPAQASREDVLAALGVVSQTADYVVVVDESKSMLEESRYSRVQSALADMMGALGPEDHVSLITFSDKAQVVYRGTDKKAALAALPAAPTGSYTDIGAGISAGLDELAKDGADVPGVLVLITDGLNATRKGAPFENPGSQAWLDLRARAGAMDAEREIAAYAIGLAAETDAGLLADVFPGAVMVPGDRIGQHLATIDNEFLSFRAAERLRPDAAATITATWEGLDAAALAAKGEASATLTLTSAMSVVPVEVSGLALAFEGLNDVTADLPETVSLAPGQAQSFPVTIRATRTDATGKLTLTATVESPWQDVMASVGVPLAATVKSEPVLVDPLAPTPSASPTPRETAPGTPGTSVDLPRLGGVLPWVAGLGGLAVVLLLWGIIRSALPRMNGSLNVTREGAEVWEFLLKGRSVHLADALGKALPGITGSVKPGPKSASGARGVRLSGRIGSDRAKAVLTDGESVNLGPLTVTYTALRTRTLNLVRTGIEEDAPGEEVPE